MEAAIPLTDWANLPANERDALALAVAGHRGLDDLFAWGRRQSPPAHPADVIQQDEFTHDVRVPLPGGRWLVWGTTGLGAVRAVSVWDHKPSAQEVLGKRIAAGWRPVPSQLQDGDRVEGYAACVFHPESSPPTEEHLLPLPAMRVLGLRHEPRPEDSGGLRSAPLL